MAKVCPVCDTVYTDSNAFCPVDGTTLHVVDLEGGLVGSVVADRYLITDLLGEGGMGKVYLARHVRLPQQAAIKVLRREMVSDPAAVARFNREASNASRIDDEHVARVYDFGEAAGDTVYLAMEYVPGRTLKEVVASAGPLAPQRTAEIIRQVAQGLDAAHRLKIIHRDLKPDNVLVVEGPDGRDRVKVVDFGIAKAFGAGDGNLTKTGFVVGTPQFMSPEQLMGKDLDARSDVYALALVAFQCLTGSLPFAGDTPEQSMAARLTSQPLRLALVMNSTPWPEAVQTVFDRGLSREVSGRPESAGDFARAFSAAIDTWQGARAKGEPAATIPPRRGARRAAIAGLVVLVAAAAMFVFQATRGSSEVPGGNAVTATASGSEPAGGQRLPDSTQHLRGPGVREGGPATNTTPPVRRTADSARASLSATDTSARAREAPAVAAPAAPAVDASLRATLDSLSTILRRRGLDAPGARSVADALDNLAPRLPEASLKATAYLRLARARVLSGEFPRACVALRSASEFARTELLRAEVAKETEDLGGCRG